MLRWELTLFRIPALNQFKHYLHKKRMRNTLTFLCLLGTLQVTAQLFTPAPPPPPFEPIDAASISFADVDNDGDQDLFISGRDTRLREDNHVANLYLNDGEGGYTEVTYTPFEKVDEGASAFADVDGDNDPDLLITGYIGGQYPRRISYLYLNDGQGNFEWHSNAGLEGVDKSAIAFADVDGDQDQDVLITGFSGTSGMRIAKLYLNDGKGNFTKSINSSLEALRDGSVAFADIDNDGDQDLLTTGDGSSGKPIAKLFTNDGKGVFTLVPDTPFEGVNNCSIAFADVNGDGSKDVLITGQTQDRESISQLYTNNGSGSFSLVSDTPFIGVQKGSVTFADVDGDGDNDVLLKGANIVNRTSITFVAKLYLNDGQGNFVEKIAAPFSPVINSAVAFADVDADSDLDIVISGRSSRDLDTKMFLNQGGGNFLEVRGTAFDGFDARAVVFADVQCNYLPDRPNPDLIVTGERGTRVFRNEGFGQFALFESEDPFFWDHGGRSIAVFGETVYGKTILIMENSRNTLYRVDHDTGKFKIIPDNPFPVIPNGTLAYTSNWAELKYSPELTQDYIFLTGSTGRGGKLIAKMFSFNNGWNNPGKLEEVTATTFTGVSRGAAAFGDITGEWIE
jgi:hypothetical protein